MKRLAEFATPGIRTNSPADGFDICGARAGLGTAKFLDDLRMLALRLCDVLRIEIDSAVAQRPVSRPAAAAASNRMDRRISPNPLSASAGK